MGQSWFLLANGHWLNKEVHKFQSLARMIQVFCLLGLLVEVCYHPSLSIQEEHLDVMPRSLFLRSSTSPTPEEAMLQYVDNIVIPYFSAAQRELELPDDQVCLAIFDVHVFAAHRCTAVLQRLSAHHTHQVFVPAS